MMKTRSWFRITLFNLSVVALLGLLLRSKILFPLPMISHKHILNAHSHFAFGGWVSLALLALFIHRFGFAAKTGFLSAMMKGIFLSSAGMVLSFPFLGYATLSIVFSTAFILFTYGYTWAFISAYARMKQKPLHIWLAIASLICLVLSSAGPFTLAYILATGSANALLYKDALYFYLHFQYNGFFSLAVLSLLAQRLPFTGRTEKLAAIFLCLSLVPSFFLSLLWHSGDPLVRGIAFLGLVLVLAGTGFLAAVWYQNKKGVLFRRDLAMLLVVLALASFLLKSLLQAGTYIPALGHAVFGLRPIIIGFLHLVFLGLVSFYILAEYVDAGLFRKDQEWLVRAFIFAVVGQEFVLLIQGGGLLFGKATGIFNYVLWVFSIFLFVSSLSIAIAAARSAPAFKK